MRGHHRKAVTTAIAVSLVLTLAPVEALGAGGSGGLPGQLLRYGSAARSLALGDAFVGLADDVSTSYWNPAGLEQLRTAQLTGLHAELLDGADYEFFAIGSPTEHYGSFALSGVLMRMGGFERTTLFEDLGETFNQHESAFSLSYARRIAGVAMGMNVKAVSQSIGGLSGSGFGGDLGVYYRPTHLFSVGAVAQNLLQPELRLDQDAELWARSYRAGAAFYLHGGRVIGLTDVGLIDGGDTRLSGGMEAWPMGSFALRAGYNGQLEQFTGGIGVRRGNLQFDYAYNPSDFGLTNVFSVTWRFGVPFGIRMGRSVQHFSPTGGTREVELHVQTAVRGEPKSWQLIIRENDGEIIKRIEGDDAPPETLVWAGDDDLGRGVPNGTYYAEVVIVDRIGQEWTSVTGVEVLNFSEDAVVPMRIEVSGGE